MKIETKLNLLETVFPDTEVSLKFDYKELFVEIKHSQEYMDDGLNPLWGWRAIEYNNGKITALATPSSVVKFLTDFGIPTNVINTRVDVLLSHTTTWLMDALEKITDIMGTDYPNKCKDDSHRIMEAVAKELEYFYSGGTQDTESMDRIKTIIRTGETAEESPKPPKFTVITGDNDETKQDL